ncbi:hypothetical protein DPMN_031874 [Dreissena polymorpha]|uniref:Uncharacterized protein n=2 Tax=Dreissena polymorpha TaxID=45954 RepID=A0A9D4M3X9_DREPO|nr:hypothetical protein DPMN_031874 [Dreissena polymorpha]
MKGSSSNLHEGILHVKDPTNNTNWLPVCWTNLEFEDQKCLQNTIDQSKTGIYVFLDGVFHFPYTNITNSLVHLNANVCNSRSNIAPVSCDLCTETKQSGCCNPLAICLQSARPSEFGPAECSRNWTGAQSKRNDKPCHNGHTLSMSRIRSANITQFPGKAWTASAFKEICGEYKGTTINYVESGLNRCLQDWNTRHYLKNNYVIMDQYLNCSWSSERPCPRNQGVVFEFHEFVDHNDTNNIYCIAASLQNDWDFTVENCTTLLPPFCGKVTGADNPTQPPTANTDTTSHRRFSRMPTVKPRSNETVLVIAITVPSTLCGVIAACCCYTRYRKVNRSSGDSPRENTIINQTYGDHLDETYHLLDESRLKENPKPTLPVRNNAHELSVMDAYSMPHDSIVPTLTHVDYELTYDDQLKCAHNFQNKVTGNSNDPCAVINSLRRPRRKSLYYDIHAVEISIIGYNCLHDSLPKHYKRRSSVMNTARIKKLRSESDICYHMTNQRGNVNNSGLETSEDVKTDFQSVSLT